MISNPLSAPNPPESVPLEAPAYASVLAENTDLKTRCAALEERLKWFERQVFGRKSEQRPVDLHEQPSLLGFSADELKKLREENQSEKDTVSFQRRKTNKTRADDCLTRQGLRFGKHVPIKRIVVTPDELKGERAGEYEIIDTHYRYKLAQQPGYVVLQYELPVIKHTPTARIRSTAIVPQVLESSVADVSFLAGMLVDKFAYHLPLYRQHQRLAHSGITLARSTLTNLVRKSIQLLSPIVEAQMQNVLRSRVLAMDETPIKAGRKPRSGDSPGQMKQGWFWPTYGEDDEIVFRYSANRGRQTIEKILADQFQGVLLSDGHSAYASYSKQMVAITHAQCWVHNRRQYLKAQDIYPDQVSQMLDGIAALYRVEARIREQALTGDRKREYRQTHSQPIVDRIFAWCQQQLDRLTLTPQDPLRKALIYTLKRVPELSVFLNDADVPPDTNHLERGLRSIPMGRKNWLFCWTEVGAEQVGVIQSLIVTCQLQGIDPKTYLVDVLQRVAVHPASKVEELTPRVWKTKFIDSPMTSMLDAADEVQREH